MPIVAYVESSQGKFGKAAFETLSYAKALALKGEEGLSVVAAGSHSPEALQELAQHGATRILHMQGAASPALLERVIRDENAGLVIMPASFSAADLAARLAVRLEAALITGVKELPEYSGKEIRVRRAVFSGKAFATVESDAAIKILTLAPNAVQPSGHPAEAEIIALEAESDTSSVKVLDRIRESGKVPLAEAEIVVSGGRGMKGPEHWGMLEELAELLGAATACSKPVSDAGWRPHAEHVGQTGLTIAPNLYLAVGISGAIQHLAGVSSSRVIAVINKDPEAPFFNTADYGIAGDAFEVIPKLIAALKNSGV